jgi:hypothetical protein
MVRNLPWGARGFAVLTLVVAALNGSAQPLRIPEGSGARGLIAAAEAEGAAYRRSSDTVEHRPADRKCVDAYDSFDAYRTYGGFPVRSGEFGITGSLGGYLYMNAALHAGRRGAMLWYPDHAAADMPALVVRGRSLTDPRDTLRHIANAVTWSSLGLRPQESTQVFPSGIAFPHPGRWLLIATSGVNWGCFIVTVI